MTKQARRSDIVLFCAATFLYWAALYLYVPVLPLYAESLGASLSMVGAVVAAYAIPQMLLRVPAGVLFDALTRRRVLLIGGIMLTSLGAIGLGLAPNPWVLFLARTVTGAGAVTWVIFTVYFAAYYPPEEIGRAIGVINFIQKIAIVVATTAGGFIAEIRGVHYAFWGGAVLGVLSILAVLSAREPHMVKGEPFSVVRLKRIIGSPTLLIASLLGVFSLFAVWATLFGFVPVYANRIGASSAEIGIITMLSLGSSAAASMLVVYLTRYYGNSLLIMAGSVVSALAVAAIPSITGVTALGLAMMVFGLGSGLVNTILMAVSVQYIEQNQRATAMGAYQAIYAVGMFLGPLVSGAVAEGWGLTSVFYISAAFCLLVAGLAYLPALARARPGAVRDRTVPPGTNLT